MTKWNRSLNTSKREQGIPTAPAPQHSERRKKHFSKPKPKQIQSVPAPVEVMPIKKPGLIGKLMGMFGVR